MRQCSRKNIDDIAASWVARQDRAAMLPADDAELAAWLALDRRHLGAYARACAVFGRFDRLRALQGDGSRPVHPYRYGAAGMASRRRFLYLAAGGAAAAAACLVGGISLRTPSRRLSTRFGEVARTVLPDGSTLVLDSATEVVLQISRSRRRLALVRGAIRLDAVQGDRRPFEVAASIARIVVPVAASLAVRERAGDAVDVVVRRGGAELLEEAARLATPVRLGANMLASVVAGQPLQLVALSAVEVRRRLSWCDGMLSFDGDTLAEAAAEFARYSRFRLVIDDRKTAAMRVVGRYAADDPAGFARTVALSLGLRVRRDDGGVHLGSNG